MLTVSQKKVFEFIKQYIILEQCSPTLAEIAQGIGINSRGVVHRYVGELARKGFISIIPGHHRNIKLIEQHTTLMMKGQIAAGAPIEAIADNETLDIVSIFLGANRYALRVKGDSMIEEGIFDGDIVVCEYCQSALEGKIVVALVDHTQATLKKIKYNADQTVTLIPANANLAATSYAQDRITVQGVYIGLLRFG